MRVGFTGQNQLISNLLGKRNIHQAIAVDMAQFPPPDSKFQAAVAMRDGLHALPSAHCLNHLL